MARGMHRQGSVLSPSPRDLLVLLLAVASAFLGFGHDMVQPVPCLDPALLPGGSFDRLIAGLGKVLFVVFLLCFVVSVFVREHLHDGDR